MWDFLQRFEQLSVVWLISTEHCCQYSTWPKDFEKIDVKWKWMMWDRPETQFKSSRVLVMMRGDGHEVHMRDPPVVMTLRNWHVHYWSIGGNQAILLVYYEGRNIRQDKLIVKMLWQYPVWSTGYELTMHLCGWVNDPTVLVFEPPDFSLSCHPPHSSFS